jgi:hypothetical protein
MSLLSDRIGQFTTLPNSVIKMWPVIGMNAFALFVCLRYHSDEKAVCFPGYDTITAETGLGRHAIAKAIRALEQAGLIERKRRFSNSTVYTLKSPAISAENALMDSDPLVQNLHFISAENALPLVQNMHSNQTHLTRSIKPDSLGNAKFDDLRTALETIVGLPVMPQDVPMINQWVKVGVLPEDIQSHIDWRAEQRNLKPVRNLNQLEKGVEVSRLMRVQGKNGKVSTNSNGETVIQARD